MKKDTSPHVQDTSIPLWLRLAREVQALSQTGKMYSLSTYDTLRYERLTQIAAEMIAAHSSEEYDDVCATFVEQNGYATPRVDVRAAVIHEGKILLVKEVADNKWAMPGGWADVGDTPAASAERETWEETGYTVTAQRVVGVYDANRAAGDLPLFHAFKVVFLCALKGGAVSLSHETSAVEFFTLDEVPELSPCRTEARQIAHAFACAADASVPTYFD